MADEPVAGASFFDPLPLSVSGGLTAEQRAAIADAVAPSTKNSPPVNIRLGIQVPFGGWFVSILAGASAAAASASRATAPPIR